MKNNRSTNKHNFKLSGLAINRNLLIPVGLLVVFALISFTYYFGYRLPKQQQAIFVSEQEKNRQQLEELQQTINDFKGDNQQITDELEQQKNQPQEVIVKYEQPDNSTRIAECRQKLNEEFSKALNSYIKNAQERGVSSITIANTVKLKWAMFLEKKADCN